MIRRDDNHEWLLISQVEHARLAGEVAAVWGNASLPALPLPERLVPAIRDHDEGWREWEQAPQVDPTHGRPRDFTEMPMAVSTAIWNRSIEACRRGSDSISSPLGGLWVSRHFCRLAEMAHANRQDRPDDLVAIEAFLDDQTERQRHWKQEAEPEFAADDLDRLIETGFRLVQFFDRLSLWLCCAVRTKTEEIEFPGYGPMRLTPRGDGEVAIEPFPLSVERLELAVPARRIPARKYAGDAALQAALENAPAEPVQWAIRA